MFALDVRPDVRRVDVHDKWADAQVLERVINQVRPGMYGLTCPSRRAKVHDMRSIPNCPGHRARGIRFVPGCVSRTACL